MAALHAVILPAKVLKGGRHKIRISVAHNGETRYIVTNITIDSIKEFKNGCIIKRPDAAILNTKLRGLLQRYQSIIDEQEYINCLSCPELIYQIKNGGYDRHRTIKSVYEEYIAYANIKPSSATMYKVIWNTLTIHLNENMLAANINTTTVMGLNKFLYDRGLSSTSIRNYMMFLKVLLNYAQRCGYVQFRIDPYINIKLPEANIRQSWLTTDEVKRIRDVDVQKDLKICRDIFMLSYYLGGINMIDLLKINFNENKEDMISYVRTKTETRMKLNKHVQFKIPDEAKVIIGNYKDKNGFLAIKPFLYKNNLPSFFSYNLPKLAKKCGLKHLIFYAARKSFSQHAFDLGVTDSVIEYILGHTVDKGVTALYAYRSVTPVMATKAVRLVLDNLK